MAGENQIQIPVTLETKNSFASKESGEENKQTPQPHGLDQPSSRYPHAKFCLKLKKLKQAFGKVAALKSIIQRRTKPSVNCGLVLGVREILSTGSTGQYALDILKIG